MQLEKMLKYIRVDNKYKICMSMYNGKFLFATLIDNLYLRNVKEIECNNSLEALKEYNKYINEQGFKTHIKISSGNSKGNWLELGIYLNLIVQK